MISKNIFFYLSYFIIQLLVFKKEEIGSVLLMTIWILIL
jgi:hypothetical protein